MISSICSHHDYQFFFFFNDPAPTEIYPLPLHDALPIFAMRRALLALPVCPTHVQVDGNRCPWLADLPLPCTLEAIDRKSTRLNSSHGYISYAVFCLKKKNRKHIDEGHVTSALSSRFLST